MTQLKISHVVIDSSLQARPKVKEIAEKQPAWPVIMPSVQAFKRYHLEYPRQIVYICGSLAELSETNVRIIRDWQTHLGLSLKHAVAKTFPPDWELVVTEQPIEDYVEVATKPSFLNHVQAEIYQLTPYELKKTVQRMVINYLAGVDGYGKLRAKLNSSYKLERLKVLMTDPKCAVLRNAVAAYRKAKNEEEIAKTHGVEAFEILYLVKSSEKAI